MRHTHLYNPLCPSVGWSSSRSVRFVKKIFPVSSQSFIISLIHFFILSFMALIVCGWALSRGSDTVDILSRGKWCDKKIHKKVYIGPMQWTKKKEFTFIYESKGNSLRLYAKKEKTTICKRASLSLCEKQFVNWKQSVKAESESVCLPEKNKQKQKRNNFFSSFGLKSECFSAVSRAHHVSGDFFVYPWACF